MKVLVTGATSGLGRNLVDRLLKENYEVTATGRNLNIGNRLQNLGARFLAADLTDRVKISSLCEGQNLVFHCGALSSPWGKYRDFYETNVNGTKNVIAGCLKHHVGRLIYTSTPSIYFRFREQKNIKEDALLPKPVNHYAATKRLAEQEVDRAFHKQGLPTVTIRPRAIFGPFDTAVIPRILRTADRGKLPLMYQGKAIIDITFVANVVDSLLLCAHAPDHVLGKKYNITNGEPLEFLTLMQKLFAALGRPLYTKNVPFWLVYSLAYMLELVHSLPMIKREPLFTRYTAGVVSLGQTLDIEAAKRDLGYKPRISINDGLQIYVDWLQNHDKDKL